MHHVHSHQESAVKFLVHKVFRLSNNEAVERRRPNKKDEAKLVVFPIWKNRPFRKRIPVGKPPITSSENHQSERRVVGSGPGGEKVQEPNSSIASSNHFHTNTRTNHEWKKIIFVFNSSFSTVSILQWQKTNVSETSTCLKQHAAENESVLCSSKPTSKKQWILVTYQGLGSADKPADGLMRQTISQKIDKRTWVGNRQPFSPHIPVAMWSWINNQKHQVCHFSMSQRICRENQHLQKRKYCVDTRCSGVQSTISPQFAGTQYNETTWHGKVEFLQCKTNKLHTSHRVHESEIHNGTNLWSLLSVRFSGGRIDCTLKASRPSELQESKLFHAPRKKVLTSAQGKVV